MSQLQIASEPLQLPWFVEGTDRFYQEDSEKVVDSDELVRHFREEVKARQQAQESGKA